MKPFHTVIGIDVANTSLSVSFFDGETHTFQEIGLFPVAQEAQAINDTWALTFVYLGVILLKRKLSKWDVLAGFICYFCVLIIATKGAPMSLEFSYIHGVMLALASTVLWSL